MKAVITYHSVDPSGSVISIDAAAFRRQVEWLAKHGPRIVTVDELLELPANTAAAAITFDDAFVNFAVHAWPILRDHALAVTVYVPTDHVGGNNVWSAGDRFIPQLPLLDWDTLGRLAGEGVTLGSHSCTHPYLSRLGTARIHDELNRSADQLEQRAGVRPKGLAYPYGDHDARIVAATALLYDHACTTELRILHHVEDRHRLPRLDAYYLRQPDALESWGTSRFRLYLRARAGARRARQLLALGSHR